jgi:hypothetical protein
MYLNCDLVIVLCDVFRLSTLCCIVLCCVVLCCVVLCCVVSCCVVLLCCVVSLVVASTHWVFYQRAWREILHAMRPDILNRIPLLNLTNIDRDVSCCWSVTLISFLAPRFCSNSSLFNNSSLLVSLLVSVSQGAPPPPTLARIACDAMLPAIESVDEKQLECTFRSRIQCNASQPQSPYLPITNPSLPLPFPPPTTSTETRHPKHSD